MKLYLLKLIFLLCLISNAWAQQNEIPEKNLNPFSLGIRTHYGFVIQHSSWVASVQGAKPKGLELDLNWHLNSSDPWRRSKGYPSVGASFFFFDYGKKSVLGYGFGGTVYIEHYFGFPSSYNIFLRGGLGPAYLTNPFNDGENPTNMSYAMYLNFHLFLNLGLRWQMGENWYGNFSVNMNHDSNAGIKEPNGGLNYPTISIGAGYTFHPGKFIKRGDLSYNKINRWDLAFYWGLSAVNYPDMGQYPMIGIDLIRNIQVTRLGSILYGFEFEYNGRGAWKNRTYHHNKYDPYRASIRGGWEFDMGRTKFSIALGLYLYRTIVESDFIYQRFGVVYNFTGNMFGGISFKSYRHVADFVDFRIGYSFL